MTAKAERGPNKDTVRLGRRVLLGSSLRNGTIAAATTIVFSLCIAAIQFTVVRSLFPGSAYRWSPSGLLSILFFSGLLAIVTIYSHTGGGLVDCCAILFAPLVVSNVTFTSVALTTGAPVPIWEPSFSSGSLPIVRMAVYSALLWSIGLGALGFAFGALPRVVGRIESS